MFKPERLKRLRVKSRISREELVRKLAQEQVSVVMHTVYNWERGETVPDANEIAALSMAFDVPVGYFFTLKNNKTCRVV